MESDNEGQDQENDNYIELTKEFANGRAQPCSIIELISLFKNDEKSGIKPLDDIPVVKDTKEYIYLFNKYGISENIANKAYNIRRIFNNEDNKFTSYETTSLVDLVPTKVEEAFSLIPSLKKKDNLTRGEMQKLLDELNKEAIN